MSPIADNPEKKIAEIERLILLDPGGRNVAALLRPGDLAGAAQTLRTAERVTIVSGFFIVAAGAGETDGPPGALALGNALSRLGAAVDYVTDARNRALFEALGAAPLHEYRPGLLEALAPTHLVAVERSGRAADGRYYDMRGTDITAFVDPLDEWFLDPGRRGLTTIGIGDGGNEVGMGRVQAEVKEAVTLGGRIGSVVPADFLVVAGVSNWGAYGLVGALSLLKEEQLLPTGDEAKRHVLSVVEAGGVDGFTRERADTVDGVSLEDNLRLLERIREVVKRPWAESEN